MSEYRTIKTLIWCDPFFESLDASGKLLFIYLFSNNSIDNLGIFEVTVEHISHETSIPKDKVKQLLQAFQDNGKISTEKGRILVHNFIENQTSSSWKVRKGQQCLFVKCKLGKIKDTLTQIYPNLFAEIVDNSKNMHNYTFKDEDLVKTDGKGNGIGKGIGNGSGNGSGMGSTFDTISESEIRYDTISESEIRYNTISKSADTVSEIQINTAADIKKEIKRPENTTDNTPYSEIQSLYNEICVPVGLPHCATLNDSRRSAIKARCHEKVDLYGKKIDFADIANWKIFFKRASENDYVLGKKNNPNDPKYKDWKGSIDYLISPKGFTRVIEGRE